MPKQNLEQIKMMRNDREYRHSKFKEVFGTESGSLVLDFLEAIYDFNVPDFQDTNKVFFKLGRKSAVKDIRIFLEPKQKKEKEKTDE